MKMQGSAKDSRGNLVRLARLRKLCQHQQVAAVCYRVRPDAVEFLLIQTRSSGRWTFPKGSAEAGLTHAQAAALEAFEEAGVHGRIENAPFATYVRRKPGQKDFSVSAHLCEVRHLGPAQESKRNRTWFSAEAARQRLREGRRGSDAAQFSRVVDKAVDRIRGQQPKLGAAQAAVSADSADQGIARDALQRVQFEALANGPNPNENRRSPSTRLTDGKTRAADANPFRRQLVPCEILEFSLPSDENSSRSLVASGKKPKALSAGPRHH